MVSKVYTAALQGLEVAFVEVETDAGNGLPVMHLIGYLSAEVKEAAERVRAAIKNSGLQIPPKKLVVNLSPADVRKTGSGFDLPIAVSILFALGEIASREMSKILILGELGLDGEVRKVSGVLPIVLEAKKAGYDYCVIPAENMQEAALVEGISILGVRNLEEVIQVFHHNLEPTVWKEHWEFEEAPQADYRDIHGQTGAKRAVEIAVAGHHNLLFVGPPGAGKTMIASRIPSILPPLTKEERMEISKIYSVLGLLDARHPYVHNRPFRSAHHTITKTALIGGGIYPKPGEISLASGGVLFLDELAEFPKELLEMLRQPLEEHQIRINRIKGTYCFPADFFLVAAMNPCSCGNYPDLNKCTCTHAQLQQYRNKISQPFMDRMDICVEVPKVAYEDLRNNQSGESSQVIQRRIIDAIRMQKKRFQDENIRYNSQIPAKKIEQFCELDKEESLLMERAFEKMNLTARTYHKVLRVARTIADLDQSGNIRVSHLTEALGCRALDRSYWEVS